MIGTTITLKNVPPALHRSLKENAKRNKRSLNQEAIHALEASLAGSHEHRSTLRQPPPVRSVGGPIQAITGEDCILGEMIDDSRD